MPKFDTTPDYYTVRLFDEIEDFDKDQYGNTWYNVLFVGDAETYMWLKKDIPKEGEQYYGHIEPTKSGKRFRFKTDKLPEGAPRASGSSTSKSDAYLKDVSNTAIMVYNGSLNYAKETGLNLITDKEDRRVYFEYVKDVADELLTMVDNVRASDKVTAGSPSMPTLEVSIKEDSRPSKSTPPASNLGDTFRAKKAQLTQDFDEKDVPDFDGE